MDKKPITLNKLQVTKRHMPHWQLGGSWYFVTFRSLRSILFPDERNAVVECIKYGHRGKYLLAAATVMPDHVHLLLQPSEAGPGRYHDLGGILKVLKGYSAKRINALSGKTGRVWQSESFDRIVRDEGEWREKYEYIRGNAVKAGLAEIPQDYPWLIEGDDFITRP